MELGIGAINRARRVVIEKLAAYREDCTQERLADLQSAIDDWLRVAESARTVSK